MPPPFLPPVPSNHRCACALAPHYRNIPSAALTLRYDIMPYVGALVPGVAARARNPAYKGGATAANGAGLGEWEFAMPRVQAGGIAK